jgi:hypothetical protein
MDWAAGHQLVDRVAESRMVAAFFFSHGLVGPRLESQ